MYSWLGKWLFNRLYTTIQQSLPQSLFFVSTRGRPLWDSDIKASLINTVVSGSQYMLLKCPRINRYGRGLGQETQHDFSMMSG